MSRKATKQTRSRSKPKANPSRRKAKQVVDPNAQYESGQLWSPRRSYVRGFVRDARFDADSMTRNEILRKARYWERNSAIVNRLADLFEQYTVGPRGLTMIPSSSDEAWNQRASEFWDEWCRTPVVDQPYNFATVQSLLSRTWMVDGEAFVIKTRGRPRPDGPSYPRIQLMESHRCSTPMDQFGSSSIIDGIQIETTEPAAGRPLTYFFRQVADTTDVWNPIPASEVIHIHEPSRIGMYRSLSMLYPVLNDLHDLEDLQLLEMDAAKDAARVTNVIKTKTGEVDQRNLRRARLTGTGTQGTSGGSSVTRDAYYDDVFEGRAKVLKHDDEFQQFVSQRPSVAQQQYWDYLTSKVCAGVGISKLLVFPWSMQGTVTRADLDVAATFFRGRSELLASKFSEIYNYVIYWGTRNDIRLADPPMDWRNVTVRPPRSVNVDVGRNSNALIAEYAAGWRTLEGICLELGEDYRKVLNQRGKELKLARQIEIANELPPGTLISSTLDALKQAATQPQEKPSLAANV